MEWVKSGDYDRIVAGDYPSRDEPHSPRSEASDAVAHYAGRFRDTFKELGDSIEDTGQQLSDWLRRTRDADV
jgi:hypothetical protein